MWKPVMLVALATAVSQQTGPRPPAVPTEPIAAILDAFKTHRIVALGEGPHNNEQGHAFRLSLIRDPGFAATVNDIVVESGTARYQDVMDRFIRGETVSDDLLRRAWRDTTVGNTVWDKPIYEEFFRAVRAINAPLPPERRLRVLLGDPPIDWDAVRTRDDLRPWLMKRDSHAADVIQREVLARQRRALVVYGDGHLQGRGFPAPSLVVLLERAGTEVFAISSSFANIQAVQADVGSWRVPSLTMVRGTLLGAKEYGFYYPLPPGDEWKAVRMEDQFDAFLYLGPPAAMTMSPLPPALCADAGYMEMRLRRMAFDPGPPGRPTSGDRLKEYCAAQNPK